MKTQIYVYRQRKINKEDKIKNVYDLLKTKEYIENHTEIVQKKNINTFVFTNQKLANANFIEYKGKLDDFNLKTDDNFEEFDGIFEALFICITDDAVYYNMYVAISTPLGMVHKKVKLNPIILDIHTIQF